MLPCSAFSLSSYVVPDSQLVVSEILRQKALCEEEGRVPSCCVMGPRYYAELITATPGLFTNMKTEPFFLFGLELSVDMQAREYFCEVR